MFLTMPLLFKKKKRSWYNPFKMPQQIREGRGEDTGKTQINPSRSYPLDYPAQVIFRHGVQFFRE